MCSKRGRARSGSASQALRRVVIDAIPVGAEGLVRQRGRRSRKHSDGEKRGAPCFRRQSRSKMSIRSPLSPVRRRTVSNRAFGVGTKIGAAVVSRSVPEHEARSQQRHRNRRAILRGEAGPVNSTPPRQRSRGSGRGSRRPSLYGETSTAPHLEGWELTLLSPSCRRSFFQRP